MSCTRGAHRGAITQVHSHTADIALVAGRRGIDLHHHRKTDLLGRCDRGLGIVGHRPAASGMR